MPHIIDEVLPVFLSYVHAPEFYTLSGMVTNLMGRNMNENKKGVLPSGCWAHAHRRKFKEALKEDEAGHRMPRNKSACFTRWKDVPVWKTCQM